MTLTDERVILASGGEGSDLDPDPAAPQPGGDVEQPDPQPGGDTADPGKGDDLDGTTGGPGADWD